MSEEEIRALLEPYAKRLSENRKWDLGKFLGAGATAATFEVTTADDALLVDEIQDLSAEEIKLFDLLSDRIMMVGDSRQKLFDGSGLEAAEKLNYNTVELKHHFRISPEIARVADSILLPGNYKLSEYCHYRGPTPSTPVIHSGLAASEQLDQVIEALDLQLDAYNDPTDMIGIVSARTTFCDAIKERLDETRFGPMAKVFHSDIENRSFSGGNRICIVTTQSCKGLEFRALHWLLKFEKYSGVQPDQSHLRTCHRAFCFGYYRMLLPPRLGCRRHWLRHADTFNNRL